MPLIASRFRSVLLGAGLLAGVGLAPSAWASCSISPLAFGFVPQDVQMDMGQVVILSSIPVGAVIKELPPAQINERFLVAGCDLFGGSAIAIYNNAAQQTPVPGFSNVYATDVAGVGIRVYRDSGSVQFYYPHTRNLPFGPITLNGGQFRVQLIKTAAQTGSGPIAPTGRFTTYYYDGDGPSRPVLTSSFKGSGTTVVSPTCAVQAGSKNVVVDFGSVGTGAFNGVGSRALNRDFTLKLDCQGSNMSAYQSQIGIRLDATQDSSNLPGVLQIAGGSNAATGIGIELVDMRSGQEAALQFGQALQVGTTVPGTSTFSLPLRARYIQTVAGQVGAGNANGTATFTIEYN